MKNLLIILSMLTVGSAVAAPLESENNFRRGYDGNAYIFIEGDVEFSVFPDGQFDFIYVGPQRGTQITISSPNTNISFNSGYNYDAYVQYDDYGAVIQIENVPIYYDEYGRIVRAGNVDIRYNDRRIVRIGGMHVIYNHHGYFSHCTGAINYYNPYYVYRPWHVYYARPLYTHVIVYDVPYRRYYTPVRYSYQDHIRHYRNRGRVAYPNARREFYRPGSRIHHNDGRVVKNTDFDPNLSNTMIANTVRNDQPVRTSRTDGNTNTIRGTRVNDNKIIGSHSGIRTSSSNVRTNTDAPVQAAPTRSSTPRTTVNQNSSVSNTKNIRNPRTSSPASVTRDRQAVPTRNSSNASTVRQTNSPTRNSAGINSSRENSSRQGNSARTRG